MDTILNVYSTARQPQVASCATGVRYSYNFRQDAQMCVCDQLWLPTGQYELLRNGSLPPGAVQWNDGMREIERSALYDIADRHISKYTTDDPDTNKRNAWVEFKRQVRATPRQENYPQEVTYPALPE